MVGGAELIRVTHAFESCPNEPLRVDEKHPGIGLKPPLQDLRCQLTFRRIWLEVAPDLDVNEGEPASVRGLQRLNSVNQRPAGGTRAEGGGGEGDQRRAVLGNRVGNR